MVRRYVAIQFTILLAVTTVFLFTHEQLPAWSERALAGLIVLWVMDMGLLLEGLLVAFHPFLHVVQQRPAVGAQA